MDGNTMLHQLMATQMENTMSGITEGDALYQKTKQKAEEYSDKPMLWACQRGRSCSSETRILRSEFTLAKEKGLHKPFPYVFLIIRSVFIIFVSKTGAPNCDMIRLS